MPGAEESSSMARVWMESTMTRSKSPDSMVLAISLLEVEAAKLSLSESAPRRTARSLTWEADSSPDIYNTLWVLAVWAQICMRRVDLPMPGWPARRDTEPIRMPPPRTVLRSSNSVMRRALASLGVMVEILTKLSFLPEDWPLARADLLVVDSGSCSVNEFQAPQLVH